MKLLKNRVAKAGMAYTIGNMLIKGIAFISTPIFTRLMTPNEYGVVNNYLAYEAILTVFVGLLTYSSIKSAKYEFKDSFDQYISDILLLNILVAIIYIVMVNLFAPIIIEITGLSRLLLNLLILNCLGTTIIYVYNNYLSLSYSYKKYLTISAFNAILNIVLSLLLMVTVLENNRSYARILGYCIPLIILTIVLVFCSFRRVLPSAVKEHYIFVFKYSLPLLPNGVSDVLLAQFDRIMIQNIVGSWAVGIYSLSYTIYSIIAIIRNSADMVWGPWCFEKLKNNDYGIVKARSLQYTYFMLLMSVVVMIITPEIVALLGPIEYQDAKYTAIPLILASFFVFLNTLPTQIIYYYKKTSWISIGAIIATVMNVGLNYLFLHHYGYITAAYTTAFSYLFLFYFNAWVVKKILKKSVLDLKNLSFLIFISVLFAEGSIFLNSYRFIRFIILMVILAIVFILVWKNKDLIKER